MISDFILGGPCSYPRSCNYVIDFMLRNIISLSDNRYFWVVDKHKVFFWSTGNNFCPWIPVPNLAVSMKSRKMTITYHFVRYDFPFVVWLEVHLQLILCHIDTFATLCHHFQFYQILNSHPLYNTILIMWFFYNDIGCMSLLTCRRTNRWPANDILFNHPKVTNQ